MKCKSQPFCGWVKIRILLKAEVFFDRNKVPCLATCTMIYPDTTEMLTESAVNLVFHTSIKGGQPLKERIFYSNSFFSFKSFSFFFFQAPQ